MNITYFWQFIILNFQSSPNPALRLKESIIQETLSNKLNDDGEGNDLGDEIDEEDDKDKLKWQYFDEVSCEGFCSS